MINSDLAKIVQDAARAKDLKIMQLNELCEDLTYSRVSKVWHGVISAKFCDVEYVLGMLDVKIHFVSKGSK
tara:strand:- start:148 stop:360 length:213 start_codon:yes stop_codon:yes gene_type:complete